MESYKAKRKREPNPSKTCYHRVNKRKNNHLNLHVFADTGSLKVQATRSGCLWGRAGAGRSSLALPSFHGKL